MKKLFAALALCAGMVTFANGSTARAGQEEQAGKETETLGEKTKRALGLEQKPAEKQKSAELFKTSEAFNLSGTVTGATAGTVKIERPGLPTANLEVRGQTVVLLDGKPVNASAIPEGSSVRASFQLDGGDSVAVRIDAKSKSSP